MLLFSMVCEGVSQIYCYLQYFESTGQFFAVIYNGFRVCTWAAQEIRCFLQRFSYFSTFLLIPAMSGFIAIYNEKIDFDDDNPGTKCNRTVENTIVFANYASNSLSNHSKYKQKWDPGSPAIANTSKYAKQRCKPLQIQAKRSATCVKHCKYKQQLSPESPSRVNTAIKTYSNIKPSWSTQTTKPGSTMPTPRN